MPVVNSDVWYELFGALAAFTAGVYGVSYAIALVRGRGWF